MIANDLDLSEILKQLTESERADVSKNLATRLATWKEQVRKKSRDAETKVQSIKEQISYWEIEHNDNEMWFATKGEENPDNGPTDIKNRKMLASALYDKKEQLDGALEDAESAKATALQSMNRVAALEPGKQERELRTLLQPYLPRIKKRKVREAVNQKTKGEKPWQEDEGAWLGELLKEAELAQPKEEEQRKRSEKLIRQICERRGIDCIYHFTPFENIPGIACLGVRSREALRTSEQNIITPDLQRLDGWNNWISVSVSFPNDKLFYVFRRRFKGKVAGWAIIRLAPSVLWERVCRYLPSNAASSDRKYFEDGHWSSENAVERLFSNLQMRQDIPDHYTTDPQAEVMVRDHIPKSYVQAIVVKDEPAKKMLGSHGDFPIVIDPSIFQNRFDHDYWALPGKRVPFD